MITATSSAANRGVETMHAWVQSSYGSPDVLSREATPVPTAATGQLRVRVVAASVNARDWHIMRGEPRIARLLDRSVFRRKAPAAAIRGTDFAGTVDSVGSDVTGWRPGDRVFGEAVGSLAQYVVVATEAVARIPVGTAFEQAAAIPLAATTALTCLRAADPSPGERILINGGSGGVGTFAIQLATAFGLHVTAVCNARNAALARSLGADVTIDYNSEDFCATAERYAVVLDLVGNRAVRALRALVDEGGTLVLSGGGVSGKGRFVGPIGLLIRAQLLSRLPGPEIVIPEAHPTREMLQELATLISCGALESVIEHTYRFDEAPDAIRHLETEHARGKVVVTIADQEDRS
jgi:NADPH:quinone reductase-like Zn-dependent oxidoreductase